MSARGAFLTLGLILCCAGAATAQEDIVTLTDLSGATVRLTTFEVCLDEGRGDWSPQQLLEAELYGYFIYLCPPAIPLRLANGVFEFATFDKISEYQADGKTATVILVSGDRIVGSPLVECKISGEGTLGKISLREREVKALKFNSGRAKAYLEAHEDEKRRRYGVRDKDWPGDYKPKGVLTLTSGNQIRLQNLAFLWEDTSSGCDDNYIPCKPYSRTDWKIMHGIPAKYGTLEIELDLAKLQSLEIKIPAKPATIPIGISASLRSGEKIAGTVNVKRPIGLLGMTDHGYAQVPLGRIRAISFGDGS